TSASTSRTDTSRSRAMLNARLNELNVLPSLATELVTIATSVRPLSEGPRPVAKSTIGRFTRRNCSVRRSSVPAGGKTPRWRSEPESSLITSAGERAASCMRGAFAGAAVVGPISRVLCVAARAMATAGTSGCGVTGFDPCALCSALSTMLIELSHPCVQQATDRVGETNAHHIGQEESPACHTQQHRVTAQQRPVAYRLHEVDRAQHRKSRDGPEHGARQEHRVHLIQPDSEYQRQTEGGHQHAGHEQQPVGADG